MSSTTRSKLPRVEREPSGISGVTAKKREPSGISTISFFDPQRYAIEPALEEMNLGNDRYTVLINPQFHTRGTIAPDYQEFAVEGDCFQESTLHIARGLGDDDRACLFTGQIIPPPG
ncbi:hypothetical protein V491_03778 [Pseudogymnoascus sp. VKM F-3775]|nr:hypothetical protein V491_03778 [Pseudogymnoascus sp. VKM F-3775]